MKCAACAKVDDVRHDVLDFGVSQKAFDIAVLPIFPLVVAANALLVSLLCPSREAYRPFEHGQRLAQDGVEGERLIGQIGKDSIFEVEGDKQVGNILLAFVAVRGVGVDASQLDANVGEAILLGVLLRQVRRLRHGRHHKVRLEAKLRSAYSLGDCTLSLAAAGEGG